jgi:hypothetical protein
VSVSFSVRLVHAVTRVVSGARKWERRIVFRRVGLTSSPLETSCLTGGRELTVRTGDAEGVLLVIRADASDCLRSAAARG